MERSRPYETTLSRSEYERQLRELQIELLKMQRSVIERGDRIVILFEGRDAAGKGGSIRRFLEHLNPRTARVVALPKPTEAERTQWYFQRYVSHLPSAGEIVLFDRSWYNRAGVERVMGFCSDAEYEAFMSQVTDVERNLASSGIRMFKMWFTVSQEEQRRRFEDRRTDPLKQWKLSPMDLEAINKFGQYGTARDAMLRRTDHDAAPWTVINSNDKRRARLEALRCVLAEVPYEKKRRKLVTPDPLVTVRARDAVRTSTSGEA